MVAQRLSIPSPMSCHHTFRESQPAARWNAIHTLWNRINAKLAWIEVFHDIWIAKLGEIGDAVDAIGKIRAIFQAQPISPGRNTLPRDRRLIQIRILILNVKGFYPRLTAFVLA